MKTKGLWMVAGLGILLSAFASAEPNVVRSKDAIWPNGVKELPLYELTPKPIPIREVDPRVYNVLDVVHHVFFERTPHSLTLGARLAW